MILIGLGANLPSVAGTPEQTLRMSLVTLSGSGVNVKSVSRLYQTPAWPDPSDPPFVNAVARVETARDPAALMALLVSTEDAFGRVRGRRNSPRTLDLDLLDYEGRVEPGPPVLPHPRLRSRGFVLVPLADVAPAWRHPESGQRVDELIAALPAGERAAVTPLGPFWP